MSWASVRDEAISCIKCIVGRTRRITGEKDGENGDVGTQLGFGGPNSIMVYGCPRMSLQIILNTNRACRGLQF
jgi:hypothetical protein